MVTGGKQKIENLLFFFKFTVIFAQYLIMLDPKEKPGATKRKVYKVDFKLNAPGFH